MKKDRASISAEGIALIRAIESERAPAIRVCYDPLARKMISPWFYVLGKLFTGYGERRGPGVMEYLAARTRFIDDYLQVCLSAGIKQLVILGAGFDSRPYRFEALRASVKVFEVDHPATQRQKREKLVRIFGSLPPQVVFVPIDFNTEALDKLFAFGYAWRDKTLFIWEGVTYYLTPDAVDSTLSFVQNHSGPGSSIIFDYMYTSALYAAHKRGEIKSMQRYRRFTGEGLLFGIDEGKAEEFMRQRGFVQIENTISEDFKRLYFTGVNRDRPIAPIYAIVHASIGARVIVG